MINLLFFSIGLILLIVNNISPNAHDIFFYIIILALSFKEYPKLIKDKKSDKLIGYTTLGHYQFSDDNEFFIKISEIDSPVRISEKLFNELEIYQEIYIEILPKTKRILQISKGELNLTKLL